MSRLQTSLTLPNALNQAAKCFSEEEIPLGDGPMAYAKKPNIL